MLLSKVECEAFYLTYSERIEIFAAGIGLVRVRGERCKGRIGRGKKKPPTVRWGASVVVVAVRLLD